ncbi:MAG: TlpA family protein disulfide reductase [Rhizobiales bacterium]|nr:TlpA family protein disulfide reductase [Hyphomicrobiales bacterium]MBI3674748.1 TlpA family protein disulfide reductase [Hyphomicrobiales bacterium]
MRQLRRAAVGALFPLAVSIANAAQPPFAMSDPLKELPELQFTGGAGQARTLANFTGKVVLLNIWATWCVPCRKEIPTFDRPQAALGGPDFEVAALSIDAKGMDAVNKFYAETGIRHLARYVTSAGNAALETLGVFGLPATFLIGRRGGELGRKIDPAEWDSPEMTEFLKQVIKQQKETNP